MSVYLAYLTLSFFCVISIWVMSFEQLRYPGFFGLFLSVCLLLAATYKPAGYVYELGPKEYIVHNDSVVQVSYNRDFRLLKPNGEIRSFELICKEFMWETGGAALQDKSVIITARGTPELAEMYYALKDSVSNPFGRLHWLVKNTSRFNWLDARLNRYHPAVRPAFLVFKQGTLSISRKCP